MYKRQPVTSLDLVPCDFWLFPKLKSPFKGKRFQTVDEIQENITGQLMAIGRTLWGPEVPTLKGTRSLSYVQCFLYLVSSSINVSIFYITWLDTFWRDLTYSVMVNFMGLLDWDTRSPDIWSNMILNISVRLFLPEISFWIYRLKKADCPPQCGWASSNQLKAWIQKKRPI